jgi:hypothetical protein
MTEQTESKRKRLVARILTEFGLPALAFAISVGIATRNWLVSLVTGLAVSGAITGPYSLDHKILHPRLEKLSRDWLHLGLEMTFLLLDHVLGALAALLVCSRLFAIQVTASVAWMPVAGMVIAFPIIHGTEMALRYFRQLREKERQEEQLRTLATEAELKALKAQIDPHFLFNTLNTIASLIYTDPDRAETTVERLAEMFRYVLNGSERRLVPPEEELAFVDSYLDIERPLRRSAARHPRDRPGDIERACAQPDPPTTGRERRQAWPCRRQQHRSGNPDPTSKRCDTDRHHRPRTRDALDVQDGRRARSRPTERRRASAQDLRSGTQARDQAQRAAGHGRDRQDPDRGKDVNRSRKTPLAWATLGLLAALVATNVAFLILLRTGGPLAGIAF